MAWTKIPKPAESTALTGGDAEPFGFLLAITSITSGVTTSVISGWGDIDKPTSSVWTFIAKPTSSIWTQVLKPTSSSWSVVVKPTSSTWTQISKPTT